MKKIAVIALVLTAITFVSCTDVNKSKPTPPVQTSVIVDIDASLECEDME